MCATNAFEIEAKETKAQQRLARELSEHVQLADSALNLAVAAQSAVLPRQSFELSPSCKVGMALLIRLANDLRAAAILAERGYPLQAVSLAASVYEVAYTVAYIGTDDELAKQWIDHGDPTRPFREIRLMTEQGLSKLGHPDSAGQASIEYRVYRQLCMGKHANPLLQRFYGISVNEEKKEVVLFNGPDTSEHAIRITWFALEHASALVGIVAAASFIEGHIPSERVPLLRQMVHEVGKLRKNLEAKAKERFGTEDPFPGRWRV